MRRSGTLSPSQRARLVQLQYRIDADDPIRQRRLEQYARDRRRARVRPLMRRMALGVLIAIVLLSALAAAGLVVAPAPSRAGSSKQPTAEMRVGAPVACGEDLRCRAREIAQEIGVPPRLFAALIQAESSWRVDARGAAGEIGLTQLMPRTARALGVDPYDIGQNLLGGARHLKAHYDREGTWTLALARYNGRGPRAQAYAERILRRWEASE